MNRDVPRGLTLVGDGGLRFLRGTIDVKVNQQLGHRADAPLLSEDA